MAQNNDVTATVRRYTRTDFTALRFRLTNIDIAVIANKLYTDDDLEEMGIENPRELAVWLDEMRDHLAERASLANPYLASALTEAKISNRWSKAIMEFLVQTGEADMAHPQLEDALTAWFKPIISKVLAVDGLRAIGDLKTYIEQRGMGWYRPIRRLGPGKARAIERWLASHHSTLGQLALAPEVFAYDLVELSPDASTNLVPLARIGSIARHLDGREGANRSTGFCLISAKNDLEAVQAYLYRFRDRVKTLRAYQKELERFLLWCVCYAQVPLSGVLTAGCEQYKDFLANPDAAWVGVKARKASARWRPCEGPLSAPSQRYAVLVLRGFFAWLVDVRYLGGNPWVTVKDPLVEGKELSIAIDKALPKALWDALTRKDGILDRVCEQYPMSAEGAPLAAKDARTPAAQYRLARAAILLMGFSGIRREEAANATRNKLQPVPEQAGSANGMWELSVLGKRNKWRTVFVPPRVIQALQAHWRDRGHDFSYPMHELALLSPVAIPTNKTGRQKHLVPGEVVPRLTGNGFSPDGLYQVVKTTLIRLANDEAIVLSADERNLLRAAAPHALRHTFATQATAKKVPIDVLQRTLGHVSQQTTSIYIRAERTRSLAEIGKLFSQDE